MPSTELPRDTINQHWTPREQLAAKREAFRQLADDPYGNVPESARGALESIDDAAYRGAQSMAAMTQHNENPRNHYE
jgi:hypothetical protein